jgi:hypothetical protein
MGFSGAGLVLLRLAATVAVALASYHLVEMPIRRGALRGTRSRWVAASGALAAVVAVVVVSAVARPAAEASTEGGRLFAEAPDPNATRVLLVGDSAAFTLANTFPYAELRPRITLAAQGVLGCGVVSGRPYAGSQGLYEDPRCRRVFGEWRDQVARFRPQASVVMVGAWEVLDHEVDGRVLRVGTEEYRRHLLDRLDQAVAILSDGGRAPVALMGVPCYGESRSAVDPRVGDARADDERTTWVNGVFREAAAAHPGLVTFVDLAAYLCPGGRLQDERDGVRLRFDGVHFTDEGGPVVWRWLTPQLEQLAAR